MISCLGNLRSDTTFIIYAVNPDGWCGVVCARVGLGRGGRGVAAAAAGADNSERM